MRYWLLLFFIYPLFLIAGDTIEVVKPYTLSTHPFGTFVSRIHHDFDQAPTQKLKLEFTVSRGNVWLPLAESFLVNDKAKRAVLEDYIWHERTSIFEAWNTTDYKSRVLDADGIFSNYIFNIVAPINSRLELNAGIKCTGLTGGKVPVSLLTSDEFIEWFHENVAGGHDPFGRKDRPFGTTSFYYKDLDNNSISIANNAFFLSELSVQLKYFSDITTYGFVHQFQPSFGINQIAKKWVLNPGFSWSGVRNFHFQKNTLTWGIASGILITDVLNTSPVNFNNKRWIADVEMHWQYLIPRKKRSDILALNYHLQSAYHRDKEARYNVIKSEGLSSHGHMSVSHLNRPIQGWVFMLGTTIKKTTVACFAREDFVVDNAPDAQVGWSLMYAF